VPYTSKGHGTYPRFSRGDFWDIMGTPYICMVLNPSKQDRLVTSEFPCFKIGDSDLKFVDKFKYLGHFITSNLSDDADIQREIQNVFVRTNVLLHRFHKCSFSVKILLFKSFCLCLYDVALWKVYNNGTLLKFQSCYNKFLKLFFGYKRRDSLIQLLLVTGLPSFNTVLHITVSMCLTSLGPLVTMLSLYISRV